MEETEKEDLNTARAFSRDVVLGGNCFPGERKCEEYSKNERNLLLFGGGGNKRLLVAIRATEELLTPTRCQTSRFGCLRLASSSAKTQFPVAINATASFNTLPSPPDYTASCKWLADKSLG